VICRSPHVQALAAAAAAAAALTAPASTAKTDTTMLGAPLLNRSRYGTISHQNQPCLQGMPLIALLLVWLGAVASAVCWPADAAAAVV
jgi:hypothetical protein